MPIWNRCPSADTIKPTSIFYKIPYRKLTLIVHMPHPLKYIGNKIGYSLTIFLGGHKMVAAMLIGAVIAILGAMAVGEVVAYLEYPEVSNINVLPIIILLGALAMLLVLLG